MTSGSLEFLPRKVRVVVYTTYGVALVVALCIDAWYGETDPEWFASVSRVLAALGVPVMSLVGVNVRSGGQTIPEELSGHQVDEYEPRHDYEPGDVIER